MEEDEIPLGTFPETQEDVQEDPEQAAEADRCLGVTTDDRLLYAAWEAVPPGPPDVQENLWTPPDGEASIIRRRVLTVEDPAERNCTITIDGYVRQEKYDELVNDFNNLKAKVDRLESFLSTVSSPDDEMMTI